MSGDLKFEYTPRIADVVPQLLDDNSGKQLTSTQLSAAGALERRDQDLEDFLKKLGTGGTAQSILAIVETSHAHDDDPSTGGSGIYTDVVFNVPADTSFNYYVDWQINGQALWNAAVSSYSYRAFAQISGQSPGTGFESWGWWVTDDVGPGGPFGRSGHGGRREQVSGSNYGATINLDISWSIASGTATRIRHTELISAALVAIPV